ncbi:glycerol kinase isoform X1 [Leguminivora glycinivorella]|uniref:glycerol kinase isoform X1 n=2 Tax=Leguminivora glycinivorella TaxID=1035111 RepID=UPI00200F2306|nr:glycerol kinase isoform X1 [Leguminivora glycinivorella]
MDDGDMPVKDGSRRSLVGVIDDGTKTVRVVIYEAERSEELAAYQLDKTEVQPQEGWSEQDPLEIIHHIKLCAEKAIEQLAVKGYSKDDIVALGITNQRETTIAWDRFTGEPLHPAIAWNDIRTDVTVDAILAKVPDQNKNYLKAVSGLPISPYFSALKMRWLKDNAKTVRRAGRDKRLMFGTVDSWIVWNLTGGPRGGLHITDVTNASRTLLMNLETLNWDPMLCRLFGIHRDSLPQIRSSSEVYGVVKDGSILDGIRISGILGNQQSALVGQNCLSAGQAKNTYRSGCFLLYNTGARRVQSAHGLLTTVAYRLGPHAPPVYALEGSIAVAGGAMKFLRDNLKLIKDVVKDTEQIAGQVFSTGDVYFVPAFSGLYAPYWRKDARGIICGLTAFTTKQHIIRAALEAVCFQTRDILEAMNKDCGMPLSKLHVDGHMTRNDLLMQLQADLIGIPVLRAQSWDMSALGAAVAAGNAVGVWSVEAWRATATPIDTFLPTTTDDDRDARYTKWKMAVQRSLGWASVKKSITMTGQNLRNFSMTRLNSIDTLSNGSRKNSLFETADTDFEIDEECSTVEELLKYQARKFSIFPQKSRKERSILDDADYFMAKKECDYGLCQCCRTEKKLQKATNWESIEEMIENDPEIIFDGDHNPIVVEPRRMSAAPVELGPLDSVPALLTGSAVNLRKHMHLEKLPALFRTICNKLSNTSLT